MNYHNVKEGRFLSRPNRFIAMVQIEGRVEVCHVKNTGRCRELLVPGAAVYLEESPKPDRKTKYDLIAVQKGDRLINMDSQAPNRVALEWLPTYFSGLTSVRPETVYGHSRFDLSFEYEGKKAFMEVKGVTLERDGVVLFPDAPTERGVKHLLELCDAAKAGYEAWVLFVIQMKDVKYFVPNEETHPAFAKALRTARAAGVRLMALDCEVLPDRLTADSEVAIRL